MPENARAQSDATPPPGADERVSRADDPQRQAMIGRAVERLLAAHPDGEFDIGQAVSAQPQLEPELGSRLRYIQQVRRARKDAEDASPVGDAMTVLDSSGLEAPLPVNDEALRMPHIDGYELHRRISVGGQGAVYQGAHQKTTRHVAVKIMWGGAYASRQSKARFDREVRVLAALDHPNIVKIIDRGETTDGSWYLVMDYIHGTPLDEYVHQLSRRDPADHATLLRLFLKVCDGVHAAHARGVIHRDLKPSNIRVDAEGEPHILDFGLASVLLDPRAADEGAEPVTVTGQFVGSLPWASPEQANGEAANLTAASDVYSLGVMCYQALTGEFPYKVAGPQREVLNHIQFTRPAAPSKVSKVGKVSGAGDDDEPQRPPAFATANPAVDELVLRALEKEPKDRFQTAGEMARAIEQVLGGRTEAARRSSPLMYALAAMLIVVAALMVMNAIDQDEPVGAGPKVATPDGQYKPPPDPNPDAIVPKPHPVSSLIVVINDPATLPAGHTASPLHGSQDGGTPFCEYMPGGELVGIEVSIGYYSEHRVVSSVQGIYRVEGDEAMHYGQLWGTLTTQRQASQAPPGQAVNALETSANLRVDSLRVLPFEVSQEAKAAGPPRSEGWVGGKQEPQFLRILADPTKLNVGLQGRAGMQIDAVGVVWKARPDE